MKKPNVEEIIHINCEEIRKSPSPHWQRILFKELMDFIETEAYHVKHFVSVAEKIGIDRYKHLVSWYNKVK